MSNEKQLHQLFEARAWIAPERIAVSSGNQQITYGELNARANALAARLQECGVTRNALVGLCVDRSIEMVIGLIGILKAGGAYVPIDPAYPAKRIEFLLTDSGADVVVTVSRVMGCLNRCRARLIRVDEQVPILSEGHLPPDRDTPSSHDLAYVIYTSGSTGVPKGVLIEHINVVRLFEATNGWFAFSEQDVWVMCHSISFDFSVWEIWGALLYGGKLVIVPSSVARSPEQLQTLIRAEEATVLCQTPTAFQQFIATDLRNRLPSPYPLRFVIFGGEALDLRMLRIWSMRYGLQQPALINMYGITETTVHVTYKQISESDLKFPKQSPIGVPIPDLQIHLLDEDAKTVADGVPGEIYVSGAGVARGYLNRPELNAQRFVVQTDGTRMYRSGDRGIRQANGELVYLGRIDNQIKVRGFRIEPREIELCLTEHPALSSAIVLSHDYGERDVRLLAFVVVRADIELNAEAKQQIASDLAARTHSELPPHMWPSSYFVIPEFPRTPHGKIDREKLLLLATQPEPAHSTPVPVMTETELAVTAIWEAVLQCRDIDIHADLFDVGGTSLAAVRILVRLNERFGTQLNGSEVGECFTISKLAKCVEDAQLKNAEFRFVEAS
jgi:amino acid adenylation domain-containing protein